MFNVLFLLRPNEAAELIVAEAFVLLLNIEAIAATPPPYGAGSSLDFTSSLVINLGLAGGGSEIFFSILTGGFILILLEANCAFGTSELLNYGFNGFVFGSIGFLSAAGFIGSCFFPNGFAFTFPIPIIALGAIVALGYVLPVPKSGSACINLAYFFRSSVFFADCLLLNIAAIAATFVDPIPSFLLIIIEL